MSGWDTRASLVARSGRDDRTQGLFVRRRRSPAASVPVTGIVLAAFFRGPFDGQRLLLPCEEDAPWPRFVIPDFGRLTIIHFYLYSGSGDHMALYLYDEPSLLTTSAA